MQEKHRVERDITPAKQSVEHPNPEKQICKQL